jgi:FdrA protein
VSEQVQVEVRHGSYHDSVTLMQVSRDVLAVDGVVAAQVAMGTELNLDLMRGAGFDPPGDAGPNDLVVAIRAASADAVPEALDRLDAALVAATRGSSGDGLGGSGPEPRSIFSAVRRSAEPPTLALVSVPGPHAFAEAWSALAAGMSVMVFSDNVPVEAEVRLKEEALARGLLVMGPDCGTAVVGGAGLGFANVVQPGPVGIVAASGTGAQQLMCLLDGAGVGISHCLGVGGRDLSAEVKGLGTRTALDMLEADPSTELGVVVSKPPDDAVAVVVNEHTEQRMTKPVHFALLGKDRSDLTEVAAQVVAAAGGTWAAPRSWVVPDESPGRYPALRGLFAGGTLCDEAMVIASAALGPIRSNIPLLPEWRAGSDLGDGGHLMIDFGDDALTQGRPHPMIDQRTRVDRLAVEAGSSGVVLLDVVLGHGAHPDPASELAPAIESALATARDASSALAVVVSLCGTSGDPQGLDRQAAALHAAGASVFLSNAAAARYAVSLVGGPS